MSFIYTHYTKVSTFTSLLLFSISLSLYINFLHLTYISTMALHLFNLIHLIKCIKYNLKHFIYICPIFRTNFKIICPRRLSKVLSLCIRNLLVFYQITFQPYHYFNIVRCSNLFFHFI